MAIRPASLPTWALNNVTDPTSGQNNVVTPPGSYGTNGWNFTEKPPRQYFNWLGRVTHNWLEWFDQEMQILRGHTTVPAPATAADVVWGGTATGVNLISSNFLVQVHTLPGNAKTAVASIRFRFSPTGGYMAWYGFKLPAALKPFSSSWSHDKGCVPVACVETDPGPVTNVPLPFIMGCATDAMGGDGAILISDERICYSGVEPTGDVFHIGLEYNVGFNLIYRLN